MIVRFNYGGVDLMLDLVDNVATDQAILWFFQNGIIPEPEVFFAMTRLIAPGDIVIDGGANVGLFSIIMSQFVKDGLVFSFEPDRRNIVKLRKNIEINGLKNCRVYEEALHHHSGAVKFYESEDNGESSTVRIDGSDSYFVQSVSLDCFLNEKISLIKLDVEGSEWDVICGGRKFFASQQPNIIMELNEERLAQTQVTVSMIRNRLRGYGYSMFLLQPDGGLPAQVPCGSSLCFTKLNANVLFSTPEKVGKAWDKVYI